MSVADLIAEFRENRAKTLAAIEAADDDLLGRPVRSAGGIEGPAANVLQALAVGHVMLHLNDIMNARQTDMNPPVIPSEAEGSVPATAVSPAHRPGYRSVASRLYHAAPHPPRRQT